MKLRAILSFVILCGMSSVILGQKFGHINSQQLLIESEEVKAADAQIEAYQKTLLEKGQAMVSSFETEYNKYMTEANANTLSPVQMQSREAELSQKQQNIQKYELEVQQKIVQKREELYKPIVDKINTAIEAIGKEGNYTMIFDTASGALLHVAESEDLLAKVKAKL